MFTNNSRIIFLNRFLSLISEYGYAIALSIISVSYTHLDVYKRQDMFQCVLSQRFSADFEGDPLDYYRNLRVTNPSNYLYFYDFGDYQVIGASPESLVSVKNGEVVDVYKRQV